MENSGGGDDGRTGVEDGCDGWCGEWRDKFLVVLGVDGGCGMENLGGG